MSSPLNRPAFRRLWWANALSQIGSEIGRIGLLLFLFGEQNDVVVLAGYLLCRSLPGVILSPFAGLMVDRGNKRAVMIGADVISIICLLVILMVPTTTIIYVFTFFLATSTILFDPARKAAIPLIVSSDEVYQANAIDRSVNAIVAVVGPIVGVLLYSTLGLTITLIIDLLTFSVSIGLIAFISIPATRQSRTSISVKGYFTDSLQGISFVKNDAALSFLFVFSFVSMFCVGVWVPLAPFFITDVLHAPAEALGLSLSCFGIGGVIGGLISTRLSKRYGIGTLLLYALFIESIALLLYSLIPVIALSMFLLVIWGIAVSILVISQHSIIQLMLPSKLTGRVFATFQQAEDGALILSLLLVILLQNVSNVAYIFFAMGIVYLSLNLLRTQFSGYAKIRSFSQGQYELAVG